MHERLESIGHLSAAISIPCTCLVGRLPKAGWSTDATNGGESQWSDVENAALSSAWAPAAEFQRGDDRRPAVMSEDALMQCSTAEKNRSEQAAHQPAILGDDQPVRMMEWGCAGIDASTCASLEFASKWFCI